MPPLLPSLPALSRRTFLGLLGGAAAAAGAPGSRASAAPANSAEFLGEIIKQKADDAACGPCAVANALLNGDAAGRRAFHRLPGATTAVRLDALIRQYGARPSETYGPRRGRYSGAAGLTCEDMPFLTNDFLADAGLPLARGAWLDRLPSEDENGHLHRLHATLSGSLAAGLPPIMEVRAFAADTAAAGKPSWVNLYAHWLALVGLDPVRLTPGASGFLCRFADSFNGRVITGLAHVELNRPFMATRGFSLKRDGTQDWHWLTGHPYIVVEVPDLPLLIQTRPWQNRALVALTFTVCRAAA